MQTYRFENLRVYQDSLALVEEIYTITKLLPIEEKFALIDQLKRSSTSIVLNIAEGTGALGDKEFKNYLRISLKSLYETVAGLKMAEKLFHIEIQKAIEKCSLVGKELHALINSLEKETLKTQSANKRSRIKD